MQIQSIDVLLQTCLNQGIRQIGQIEFTEDFRLFHKEDIGRNGLRKYEGSDAAREIARYDDAGNYRPLKSAPNLRHGWELKLNSLEELRLALDFFYPAALGIWFNLLKKYLMITQLRKTLERQSGMYRIAAKISDIQAEDLVYNFCQRECLRKILWDRSEKGIHLSHREIPLYCSEACHLFISEARKVVKQKEVKGVSC